MPDIAQSTREYSIELGDDSTLEVAVSIAISTDEQNSIASSLVGSFPLIDTIEALNKAIVAQILQNDESEDDEIELESIGPDQEDGE